MRHLSGFLVLLISVNLAAQTPKLSSNDVALLKEAYHLQEKLGSVVWESWSPQKAPFLLKRNSNDFLLNHPSPPEDFQKLDIQFNNSDVYWRPRTDTLDYGATFTINEIPTVVMTAPSNEESIITWILQTAHEMFHVYQFNQTLSKSLENYINVALQSEDSLLNEFRNNNIRALLRLEADRIFIGIVQDTLTESDEYLLKKRLEDIHSLQPIIFNDSLISKFKLKMEWMEGVARYVEHQMDRYASDTTFYEPSAEFKVEFPGITYSDEEARYSLTGTINPIRFVGAGVQGRLMFYYMGMGKAYLLDRINPNWKERYFTYTLDQLLKMDN